MTPPLPICTSTSVLSSRSISQPGFTHNLTSLLLLLLTFKELSKLSGSSCTASAHWANTAKQFVADSRFGRLPASSAHLLTSCLTGLRCFLFPTWRSSALTRVLTAGVFSHVFKSVQHSVRNKMLPGCGREGGGAGGKKRRVYGFLHGTYVTQD